MRLSRYPLATLKETPADAELASHRLMLRAGLVQGLASGLYSWLPLGLRVARRVAAVVREEMDRSGALELLMPAVQPAELWRESGRWEQFGPELLRFADRHGREFCFGPTHEEVITDLVRRQLKSYRQLPVNYYQIQTKFRDEIRPRFGVMRAREFVMKDAYSFHLDQDCLDRTYEEMRRAYCRILDRLELRYRYVRADSGAIGGALSHEFHVLADSGEDEILYSDASDYAANVEHAPAPAPAPRPAPAEELRRVATPEARSVEEVAAQLGLPPARILKTLIVHGERDGELAALVLRGDHRLNAAKAARLDGVRAPLRLASADEVRERLGCPVGSLGPVGLELPAYADAAAAAAADFACGANEKGVHYAGANWERDAAAPARVADLRNLEPGEPSPDGRGRVRGARGIEVGHIFQLGDKYSRSMDCAALDAGGRARTVLMGCYGIGVTRIVAAAIEQNHDERGIRWPAALAPFAVFIAPVGAGRNAAVRDAAEALYRQCREAGIDALLDDRDLRPGVMFAEADLIGVPHRVVVGARRLEADGRLEYQARAGGEPEFVPAAAMPDFLRARLSPPSG